MAQNDRTTGLVGNAGCKVPARAASTAALVLSGEQTVDGVALVTDDRVLVKNQAAGSGNGVWVVDTGAWSRARDFDGVYDIVRGSIIHVNEGTTNAGSFWEVTTADPITIGTTSLSFSRVAAFSVILSSQTAAAGQTLINLGSTYAIGSQAIAVFVNGLRLRLGADYSETSSSSLTLTYALQVGDEVDVYIGQQLGNLTAAAASTVAITDAGNFYLGSTVEAVLQEIRDAITADVGDANGNLTYNANTPIQRWNTPLTANRTVTLNTANATEGAHFVIVRGSDATGNFTLAVGSVATLRAPGEWCEVRFDAGTTAWVLEKYGFLPTAEVAALSADKGDADATITVGTSERTSRWSTALTADRTATLATAGAWNGAKLKVIRSESSTGNFALNVSVAGVRLLRLAPGQWAEFEYSGSAWICTGFGDLRQGNSALVSLRDDYVGEEIDGHLWQSLVGTDAEVRAPIVLADQARGVVRMVTGDDAAATMAVNGVQLQSQLNWRADLGCLAWEGRVTLSAITAVAVFVGLTDQRAVLEMPFTLAAGDALTSNATDACGVLFDTGADTDNWWLVGVKADVDAVKQNTAVAPVAATFETWKIELDTDGTARFYRNGTLVGAAMVNALTASVSLTPVVAAFARGAASRNIDVDVLAVQMQR